MSDGCGKTCGCASGSVLYGGSCCTPSCPKDGTCGAADGCGGVCGCTGGGKCTNGMCPTKTCSPVCGCAETCNNGTCIPIQCDEGGLCGCSCCSSLGLS